MELDPEHRGLLSFKADVLYQQRDFEACIAHLSQCAGRVTQNGKALAGDGADDIWVHDHLTLARCLILQKDIANAMSALQVALRRIAIAEPRHAVQVRMYFHLHSICHYAEGQFEKAIELGKVALEANRHWGWKSDKGHAGVYATIARSYAAMGDLDSAVRTMQQAVCYETPWDPENAAKARALLVEFEETRRGAVA